MLFGQIKREGGKQWIEKELKGLRFYDGEKKKVFCFVKWFVSVRKRKINTLKPSYFVSGVVGLFVGFPRHKRVLDGFARCVICNVDISIAGRGLQNLWAHWKGVEHTRLEQKYRIMTQRPLLDRSCRPVLGRSANPFETDGGTSSIPRVALEFVARRTN